MLLETMLQREDSAGAITENAVYRRRWFILGLLFCITVINFIDRQMLSVLAPVICGILHLFELTIVRNRLLMALSLTQGPSECLIPT